MIKEISDQLYAKLKDGLVVLSKDDFSPHIKLRDQLALIRGLISELCSYASNHPFSDISEEVEFHKVIFPGFKSQLIYYVELYNLKLGLPLGGSSSAMEYYKKYFSGCLEDIERFSFIYNYRKLGGKELDQLYFTALGDQSSALLPVMAELDECSTAAGYLYAKFMAYELLYDFISCEVGKLFRSAAFDNPAENCQKFKWTGKTIDLIEVAHGLHLQGEVGKGQVGIVEFFAAFGNFFGVDLGIPKKGLDNLMDRKTVGRTRFTDRMRQSLHGKMDELERYDPGRAARKMGL